MTNVFNIFHHQLTKKFINHKKIETLRTVEPG